MQIFELILFILFNQFNLFISNNFIIKLLFNEKLALKNY